MKRGFSIDSSGVVAKVDGLRPGLTATVKGGAKESMGKVI